MTVTSVGLTISEPLIEAGQIDAALTAQGTVYEGETYSGLVCPCTVSVAGSDVPRLGREIRAIWEWNRTWHDLYAEAAKGFDRIGGVLGYTDYGLTRKALTGQRRSSVLKRDPRVGRIDSVALSPHQAVAEVQWKGGGEGFAAGVQAAYLSAIPCGAGAAPLGGVLTESWAEFYRGYALGGRPFVINSTRHTWERSEQYLINALGLLGVDLAFIPRQRIGGYLTVRNHNVYAEWGGLPRRVDYLSLDRMSEALPDELFSQVIDAYEHGRVHIEPPPTYLYSQKIGYALPWHPRYRDAFSDEVRSVLIPSVCLNEGPTSLRLLASSIEHPKRELLSEISSWDDVQSMPDGLRRRIVVKCGSINGQLNHGGRGVWRLGSAATLHSVLRRMERGEPWIAQPYVDRTWKVPLSMPAGEAPSIQSCHARFCLYASHNEPIQGPSPRILGGLTTFGTFWKSAGKSASTDDQGRMHGSAFVDLRESREAPAEEGQCRRRC
jgi:hypothetical protein